MRPPVALPFLKSLYKRHLSIGCNNNASLPSVAAFLCTMAAPLILSEILSIFPFSFTCTKAWKEWLYQLVCELISQGAVIYFFHGNNNFIVYKVVFWGRSSKTPATLKSSVLSSFTVLLMGFIFPNNVLAMEALNKTDEGSSSALIFPSSILNENIEGKFDSTNMPLPVIFFSPTANLSLKEVDITCAICS